MAELIVPESYGDRCVATTQRVFSEGMSKPSRQTLELNGLHRNGEEFPVEIRPWTMESAEITTIYAFIRALRERNKLREDLRFKERQFRQMVELATVGIRQSDPRTGRMVMCNEKLCEITGYSKDELLTMRVQDLTHLDDREADWNLYQKAARGETPKYAMRKDMCARTAPSCYAEHGDVRGYPARGQDSDRAWRECQQCSGPLGCCSARVNRCRQSPCGRRRS